MEWSAVLVAEDGGATVSVVALAGGDGEVAGVESVVVVWAEADEVVQVGGAAVGPVDDVVDFDVAVGGAAGEAAAAVAVIDEASGA